MRSFPGFEADLVGGSVVAQSTVGGGEVPTTHRVDIELAGELIIAFSTFRPGMAALHQGWTTTLSELRVSGAAGPDPTNHPYLPWGRLARTRVFTRVDGSFLAAFNAISSDWVLDVLAEVDGAGRPSATADRFLRSIIPEAEPELTEEELEQLAAPDVELPASTALEAGAPREVALVAPGFCFDIRDAAAPLDAKPGPEGRAGAGVWGSPRWLRIATMSGARTILRLHWVDSRDEALAGVDDWQHVAEARVIATSGRLLVIRDVDHQAGIMEVTLPQSGVLGVIFRARSMFEVVPGRDLAVGEYELLLHPGPSPNRPMLVIDSDLYV